jgi:amino acid adenylation domain-containing protein
MTGSQAFEAFRLSPQQRRLCQLQGDGPPLLAHGVLLLTGELDVGRLRRAVERVVERWEILRTCFRRQPGFKLPFQVISGSGAFSWTELDGEGPASVLDLERGPVLALKLGGLQEGGRLLRITLPAQCADPVALENLAAEIVAEYGGEAGAEAIQYADYAAWQNELLESGDEAARASREYWSLREPGAAGLPFELPGEPGAADQWGSVPVALPPEVAAGLARVAASLGVSLEEVWLAVWMALLARRTGGAEPVVRVRCDGRDYEELRAALGCFARWLPIGCGAEEGLPFAELAARLGRALGEAREHQQFFTWDGIEAGAAAFGFEMDGPAVEREAGGVTFRLAGREVRSEPCKLILSCTGEGEGASARLSYDTGLYLPQDVERLAGELRSVCRQVAAHTETKLGDLDLLEDGERRRLVVELNATRMDFGPPRPLHELVEAAAARAPEAVAVVFEEETLTYRELNARANRLARELRRLGISPEMPVGLCLERSADVVVGLLAAWKAGGAYVPLDPGQPRRRLVQMLADAGAPVVLTRGRAADGLPGTLLRLDADRDAIDRHDGSDLASTVAPENLAYVIFTSGSTGRPKGVCVEHRQLFNYVHAVLERLELPAGGSYATVSTFGADLGHTAIFPALCTGGTLHVVSMERAADAYAFGEYFERHAIDCLKIVPSHLQALQESAEPAQVLPRLRLIVGGEASARDWIAGVVAASAAAGCRVFNHYGPTEATVGVLTCPAVPASLDPRCATLPLGRPIPNALAYLLDRSMEPVPGWLPGEVFLGGAGVSRGYLGRPDLTAERFVPDLLSGVPGARLYRTGDLARHVPQGIEFLGRVDHQVKFHGFRVELAEIRAVLNGHPQVRDSVVVMARDSHDLDVLVAYYVSRQPLETGELREWLAEAFPEETVPGVLVHLRRLPLTLNGKVNVEALPTLAEVRERLEKQFVAPRNPTEERLAAIWSEVLGLSRVGIHDNFFELGGHSLLATRVASRARQSLAVEIPLRSLFEIPTIAGVAAAVEAGRFPALGRRGPETPVAAPPRDLAQQLADLEGLSDGEVESLLEGAEPA